MARPKKEEKNEEAEVSTEGPNSIMATLLKENKEDHFNFGKRVEWKSSTGSLLLDTAIGGGIKPSLIRLCGNNNEGKTPESIEILRNLFLEVKCARGVWFLAEGRLSEENKNRSGLKFTTEVDEWEDGTILIIESNVYEFIIDTIKKLVKNNPENKVYGFVIDSLDGVIRREDLEKGTEDAQKVCGPQVLTKKMLQSLSIGMFKYGHLLIMISQVTAAPQLNAYEKKPDRGGEFSGGNAALHGADWIFTFNKSFQDDYILDNPSGKLNDGKSKTIGKFATITIDKANIESAKKLKIKYPIKYHRKPSGIWREYEIAESLLMWGCLTKAGAGWMTFSPDTLAELKEIDSEIPEKIQGIDKVRIYLESKPKVADYLFDKFRKLAAS